MQIAESTNSSLFEASTPLMQQYHAIKVQYPDTLLLFQVGDFYELFFEDAKVAAAFLGITLTARGKNKGEPIPLCGVPLATKDHYIAKLVKGGFKIALCDQLEEARPGTVVRRGVTSVYTPGTLIDSALLSEKSASYVLSFYPLGNEWALLFGELMTAQLHATIIPAEGEKMLWTELARYFPDEVLIPSTVSSVHASLFKKCGYSVTNFAVPDYDVIEEEAAHWVANQFEKDTHQLLEKQKALQCALTYFYAYIRRNQPSALSLFNAICWYSADDFLLLDASTQRTIELVKNSHDGTAQHTLFAVLDCAKTAMGSRLIKKWLLRPLVDKQAIEQRQEVVQLLVERAELRHAVSDFLAEIGDAERVVGRIIMDKATLQDYLALIPVLAIAPHIKRLLATYQELPLVAVILSHISEFQLLHGLLKAALNDDFQRNWMIKKGFHRQLDYLRELAENSQQKMLDLEKEEQQKTGISSLKIRYNQIYGYTIEITKSNAHLVPAHYERIQTLVGKERYTMAILKQLHRDIDLAQTESKQMEASIFMQLKQDVGAKKTELRRLVHALSHLDALLGFTLAAYENRYVRPMITNQQDILIIEGRHPVVEQVQVHSFIPNDTHLSDKESTWIITGPNMGGKSTYLRQVALISIMAHIGSFVPAQYAEIPILDRIFTRIGSGDQLAAGKSTFLVEMEETATICRYATRNSLVILDEVGRGTSTFDGIAIAQAVVEYITSHLQARCLFATHYHELTHLSQTYSQIVCYYAASKQTPEGILFLYKMIKGTADGSFGIEVAKLAELPNVVVDRSWELVDMLSINYAPTNAQDSQLLKVQAAQRILLKEHEQLQNKVAHLQNVVSVINEIDCDAISAKQALEYLWKLKEQLQNN